MKLEQFARTPLGFFPTPLVNLDALSDHLSGPEIWMKRDDLTGLALGGNKTRKLEYLVGGAVAAGADTVVTAGAAQSNHCRQTAAAAAIAGMDCHLLLGGDEPDQVSGNLLLDQLFGARITWAGENRKGEDLPELMKELKTDGKNPYLIPYGGSNVLGAIGFVHAVCELKTQMPDHGFTHIVFASSSGGTHAGLMVGKQLMGESYQIIGIRIDKEEIGEVGFGETVISLANETAAQVELDDTFDRTDLHLNSEFIGDGYGVVGSLEREAIALLAQKEGVLLDPVYTGRAMGGLIAMVREGTFSSEDKVLFWHTGGAPALFAYSDDLQRSTLK